MYQSIAYRFFIVITVLQLISSCKGGDQGTTGTTVFPDKKNYRVTEISDLANVRKYYYGTNGVSKIEQYVDSKLNGTLTYYYNGSALDNVQFFSVKDNKVVQRYNFFYDTSGRIAKYEEREYSLPVKTFALEYDSKNRISKIYDTVYEYDNNDNPVKVSVNFISTPNASSVTVYKYDNNFNYLKKYNLLLPIGDVLYSGTNNLIGATTTESINGKVSTSTGKIDPVYDSEGKLIKSTVYINDKLQNTISYKYEPS